MEERREPRTRTTPPPEGGLYYGDESANYPIFGRQTIPATMRLMAHAHGPLGTRTQRIVSWPRIHLKIPQLFSCNLLDFFLSSEG